MAFDALQSEDLQPSAALGVADGADLSHDLPFRGPLFQEDSDEVAEDETNSNLRKRVTSFLTRLRMKDTSKLKRVCYTFALKTQSVETRK